MHSAAPLRQANTRPAFAWIVLPFPQSVFNLAELSQLVCFYAGVLSCWGILHLQLPGFVVLQPITMVLRARGKVKQK